MSRLTDLPEWERQHHLDKIRDLPNFGATPYYLEREGIPTAQISLMSASD